LLAARKWSGSIPPINRHFRRLAYKSLSAERQTGAGWNGGEVLPDATVERRFISRNGCYVDTVNPISQGSQVRLRPTHHDEIFEALARVVYVSPGLGMELFSKPSRPTNNPVSITG
jgi:hypothetical protein